MEIWAHTMVKNEGRWLWYSVTSIIEHVDKVLLWDTGSSDDSLEIEKELEKKYPTKIVLKTRNVATSQEFTSVRQEMLDSTKSDWFLMLDGDEIWWKHSIQKAIKTIEDNPNSESVVVPTINLVGDIFHYQEESAGRYRFGDKVGHYNLRAINRSIPGLHSQGIHGVWGWADLENKMIQDRAPGKIKFVNAPYLHASFIPRGNSNTDNTVIKRSKKLKHEIGKDFPKDFFYPESLFKERPEYIVSPWRVMSSDFRFRAEIETPLRKVKRAVWHGRPGY